MIRIQCLIFGLILVCSLQQHVAAVMDTPSKKSRNVNAVKGRKIATGRDRRDRLQLDFSSLEDAMEDDIDLPEELDYDGQGFLESALPRYTSRQRRLQLFPIFNTPTAAPVNRSPTNQPVAAVTKTPTNQPVAPVPAPVPAPAPAPVSAPAPAPVNRMPVEPPVGVFTPILKLVTHFVIDHIEANPLTEPVLQILNEAILATVGPTPSLIEITDWVLNEVNLRRRLMISPDCASCGDGGNQSFSYTITTVLSYTAADLLPNNNGSSTIPLTELVDLAKEVVDGIVQAVSSGALTDEIQNRADDANENVLADAEAVSCSVECLPCSLVSSSGGDSASGVQNALSGGQIAGICIGGLVACGAVAAFVTSYYYPNLFSSSKQNDGENRGNSDGEQSNAVEAIEYTENHGQAVIAAAAKLAVKKKSEHLMVTRKKSYLSVESNDILDKMERNEPSKPLSLLLPLEIKDIQVEESMPQMITDSGPPVTDDN
jgi:hypothetical protein